MSPSREAHAKVITESSLLYNGIGDSRRQDFDVEESWLTHLATSPPKLTGKLRATSALHSNTVEIRAKPTLYANTYDFRGVASWCETAVRALAASG